MPESVLLSRSARVCVLSLALCAVASAQAGGWLLASPEPRVVPGRSFELIVIGDPAGGKWPEKLLAQVELPDGGPRIALDLVPAGTVGPMQQRYVGLWPGEVVGMATLSLLESPSARLIFDSGAALRTPLKSAQARAVVDDSAVTHQGRSDEPVAPSPLSFHEPMYFVVGGNAPKSARYQISFRYRLFDDQGVVAESLPLVRGLYFGFTQTSLWDLSSDSKPFRDTSFRPSLFYQWKLSDPTEGNSAALAAGYEHESNGRDGDQSRSIDTFFARIDARYYLPNGRTYVGVEPKVWSYIDKEDNPDITAYRGYAQLGLRLGSDDGLMLAAILRRGNAGVGSTQLDLSYPLRQSVFSGVGAFAHLQYFNGYGETLLDYNVSHGPQFRIGVSIVR